MRLSKCEISLIAYASHEWQYFRPTPFTLKLVNRLVKKGILERRKYQFRLV